MLRNRGLPREAIIVLNATEDGESDEAYATEKNAVYRGRKSQVQTSMAWLRMKVRQNSLKPWRCQAITVFPCRGHGGSGADPGTIQGGPELPENGPESAVVCPEPDTPLSTLPDREVLTQGRRSPGRGSSGE